MGCGKRSLAQCQVLLIPDELDKGCVMVIALIILGLVIITVLFHLYSPWWLTPIASNWGAIDTTIEISFWITGLVFIAVNCFLAWVVWRYKHTGKHQAHYEPESKKLELWLTGLTAIGVIAMLTPGLIAWAKVVNVPSEATNVEAIGQQWQWTFRFPGADGELGGADARFVTATNPYGIDPEDPKGQDDLIVNSHQLHLPVGKPVKMLLRSNDVLHNFAVPQFRVKMDLVPGTVTYQWFEPSRVGTFDILCEELCGVAHFTMRAQVIIEEEDAYLAWLNRQPTFAQTQRSPAPDLVAGKQLYSTCAACHGVNGGGLAAMQAPNLSGLAAWYMDRQLRYYREGIRGAHPADSSGQQMAAMAKSVTKAEDLHNLLAYIESLPVVAAPATLGGDPARGAQVYQPCVVCHGANGQGTAALQAPQLAGQADWYLYTQLKYFSTGWRGKHPKDQYGSQMRLMTSTIQSPERLQDLLAYIATLPVSGSHQEQLARATIAEGVQQP
ncbi:MAG: cytochrome c oxidase subunit 2 [Zhongshania aliphaticivorans]|jgi:cytochrome c oxidase subunit 2|tara:strand:- start:16854 stop:18347 length:1494 start_codon:yes stop_codon:yes gene_type:complete